MNTIAGQRGLSGYWLKMIAVITMLIDHTAASILRRVMEQMPSWGPITPDNVTVWQNFYVVCRLIGRMAFPIYCFLLVEGFHYTKSRGKYALRLFLFALISELPFDLALEQSFFYIEHNNVFFTLMIGLLTLWGSDIVEKKLQGKQLFQTVLRIVILVTGSAVAEVLHTDYGAAGVIAIYIMYVFYQQRDMGYCLMTLSLGVLGSSSELAALLMLIPIHFYNGTRGKQMKYFFYAFYPVHLAVLALICYLLGLEI
jgi:hypothetical protein